MLAFQRSNDSCSLCRIGCSAGVFTATPEQSRGHCSGGRRVRKNLRRPDFHCLLEAMTAEVIPGKESRAISHNFKIRCPIFSSPMASTPRLTGRFWEPVVLRHTPYASTCPLQSPWMRGMGSRFITRRRCGTHSPKRSAWHALGTYGC